nr:hypothetical protein [Caballeronia sp. SL2Y3]
MLVVPLSVVLIVAFGSIQVPVPFVELSALRRVDRAGIADLIAHQRHITLRLNRAVVLDARVRARRAQLERAARHELIRVDGFGRREQRADVDDRAFAEQHAVGGLDQHLTVGEQRALNIRCAAARYAVKRLRLRVRLIELHRVAGADVERVPVDHGALRALIDGHRVGILRDARLACRDLAARRQRLRETHAGLRRQDGSGKRSHRRDDAECTFIRCRLRRRAFARGLALTDDIFRYRHQHAESFAKDATKPILVHKRDRD